MSVSEIISEADVTPAAERPGDDGAPPEMPPVDVDEKLELPRWAWWSGAGLVTVIIAAMAFAIFEPIQVLPRIELSPGYSLDTPDDDYLTSEDGRGNVTLYSFVPTNCEAGDTCAQTAEVIDTVQRIRDEVTAQVDFGETEFRMVTIALDSPDPAALATAARAAGADGEEWQWVTGEPAELRTVVGSGFEVFYETAPNGSVARFDAGYVLVDGNGVIRGDYEYATIRDTADKLAHHAGILAEEIRYAEGATALAYEAAHLFLCYP